MPFKEIDISRIIKEKSEKDPEFKEAFREASAELDLIAQIIKTRKAKGLTQKDVADKSGLTQQMVSRIEKREYPPNYKNLVKIANALDTKLELVSK
ncbi:helix-turn-helix domain-containing protein [Pelotomaculum terephthalicicum JT]|uniref:helix-turn-helix domain-containing protein n=1 Tax=Pelotomaculum terephthalicicum TaxID=206393 RepID=UPI0009D07FD3|nr:helix-turn-helix transcriptional regulator [Pelotomaculum terephthalicicum]MCG9969004.1 helix-turn-helix domain-containing protein [Pelotomaculum terephthalicicum JT]OPY61131.1 MAG: Antitoxin HigA [Pelotomaculum sp. PtaU1.Bin065]